MLVVEGIGIVVLVVEVLVVEVVLVEAEVAVLVVDVLELGASVGGLDSTGVETGDSNPPVVVVSDPQATVMTAAAAATTTNPSDGDRFTKTTVPDDLGATLAP